MRIICRLRVLTCRLQTIEVFNPEMEAGGRDGLLRGIVNVLSHEIEETELEATQCQSGCIIKALNDAMPQITECHLAPPLNGVPANRVFGEVALQPSEQGDGPLNGRLHVHEILPKIFQVKSVIVLKVLGSIIINGIRV